MDLIAFTGVSIHFRTPFIATKKRVTLRFKPCGTSFSDDFSFDKFSSILVWKRRFVTKFFMNWSRGPDRPESFNFFVCLKDCLISQFVSTVLLWRYYLVSV